MVSLTRDKDYILNLIRNSSIDKNTMYTANFYLSSFYPFSRLVGLETENILIPMQEFDIKHGNKSIEPFGGQLIDQDFVYLKSDKKDYSKDLLDILDFIKKNYLRYLFIVTNYAGSYYLTDPYHSYNILDISKFDNFEDYVNESYDTSKSRYNTIWRYVRKTNYDTKVQYIDTEVASEEFEKARESFNRRYGTQSSWNYCHYCFSMKNVLKYHASLGKLLLVRSIDKETSNEGTILCSVYNDVATIYIFYVKENNSKLLKNTLIRTIEYVINNKLSKSIDFGSTADTIKKAYKFNKYQCMMSNNIGY